MAEILVLIKATNRRPGRVIGEVTAIQPNNFAWSEKELDGVTFRLIKVPLLSLETAKKVFLISGVPLLVRLAEKNRLNDVIAAYAEPEGPDRQSHIQAAVAAYTDALVKFDHWPYRKFHIDLTALGPGLTKSVAALTAATIRKDRNAFRTARLNSQTLDQALDAALAAATTVTDLTEATNETD